MFSRKPYFFDIVIIVCVASFFCFYQLGRNTFGAGDQTIHARVVQQMLHSGDYLHPSAEGKPYFNKPPLKMWLSLIPLKVFGESNFSYRAIDGLSGVLMSVLLYVFVFRLYGQRIIAFFSSIFLLSSSLFYFGHGVRNAVQDSMMHLFVIAALFVAYLLIEKIISSHQSRFKNLLPYALGGGILTGGAIMCKGLGGAIVFPVIAVYAILSGRFFTLIKSGWYLFLIVFIVSFVPLFLYILQLGGQADSAFQMLFVSEGMKRAVKGYHFVGHVWYYWKTIVSQELTVPIVSLIIGFVLLLKDFYNSKNRVHLFVLCWAFVPILFYQCMKSKLPWYILPSLGGLSIICAYGVYKGIEVARSLYLERKVFVNISGNVILIFGLISLGFLGRNYYDLIERFFVPYSPSPIGVLAESTHVKLSKILLTSMPKKIAYHESFYLKMLKPKVVSTKELGSEFEKDKLPTIVFSELRSMKNYLKLKTPDAVQFFPPKFRRMTWLGALAYNSNATLIANELPGFVPWCSVVNPVSNPRSLGTGWLSYAGNPGGIMVRGTRGNKGRIILEGNFFHRELGSEIKFKIASTLPEAEPPLKVKIYLNEVPLSVLSVKPGMHDESVVAPASGWDISTNLLTFEISRADGEPILDSDKLLLLGEITFCPKIN